MNAYERQKATSAFVPGEPKSCELRTRSGFEAGEIERIRERAEALAGSGLFSFFERKKLREHVGYPRDTPMERIREWALAQQVVIARRCLTEALGGQDGGSPVEELLTWIRTEHRLTGIEKEFRVTTEGPMRRRGLAPLGKVDVARISHQGG